jgi:uncharacterized protein
MTDKKDLKKAVMDGWSNVITGLGIKGRDKRMASNVLYQRKTKTELEQLYAADDMASAIVDTLPEEMQREGFKIKTQDEEADLDDLLKDKFKMLEGPQSFDQALKWARLYGGSGIYMGIQDGREPDEPVDLENIKSIEFLNTMDRFELHPDSTHIQRDPSKPNFGMPMLYQLHPQTSGEFNIRVHADRILRFESQAKLPRNLFISNEYWHDSVLTKSENPIRNFQSTHDSIATLIQDLSQAVYKIKHLTEMISQGRDDLVMKRLELVDSCRSVLQAIIMEDGEEFERKSTNLAGIADVVKMINQRLVQSSRIPHTILLGESPSGLGATGQSEKRDWFDVVARNQNVFLKPQLGKFFFYCFLAQDGPTGGELPESWEIVFNPLWQLDQAEQAEVDLKNSQSDKNYIDSGVLDPDEVALSRFGNNEGSIQINTDLRSMDSFGDDDDDFNEDGDDKKTRRDKIEFRNGKYLVMSKSGKVLGTHSTRESAERQLRAVEANKNG